MRPSAGDCWRIGLTGWGGMRMIQELEQGGGAERTARICLMRFFKKDACIMLSDAMRTLEELERKTNENRRYL